MKYFKLLGAFAVFLCYVNVSFALVISEVQFDPTGTDTDREWVEIFNDTNSSVDLTTYKFFENNTNHGIDILSGDKNMASGEYAVLVQDLNKFKTDYPNYSGKIFKSSFSLSNSGESLSLKDKDGNIVNTINYSPSATGAGNGLTINLNPDGSYTKGVASPGTGNLSVNSQTQTDNNDLNSTTTSATSTQLTSTTTSTSTAGTQDTSSFSTPIYYYRSYYPESQKVYVYAGENMLGVSGAEIFFNGRAVTGDNQTANGATFFWSFGDGENAEGAKVHHAYKYPGEYVVNLEGYWNGSKNDDRIYVKISDPQLNISLTKVNDENVAQINNKSNDQVDLGGYIVKTSGGEFEKVYTIGKHLTILPHKGVNLSQDLLGFATDTTNIVLAYSSGKVISEFSVKHSTTTQLSVNDKKNLAKNIFDATTTNVSIKVFTKEEFEKVGSSSVVQSLSSMVASSTVWGSVGRVRDGAARSAAPIPATSTTVASTISTTTGDMQDSNKFVINQKKKSLFSNLLTYLGF